MKPLDNNNISGPMSDILKFASDNTKKTSFRKIPTERMKAYAFLTLNPPMVTINSCNGNYMRPMTKGEMLKKVGYSDSISKNPQAVERQPGFQNAVNDFRRKFEMKITDDLLIETHEKGLKATKAHFNNVGELVAETRDEATIHKYLDSAYKIKGLYAPTETKVTMQEVPIMIQRFLNVENMNVLNQGNQTTD